MARAIESRPLGLATVDAADMEVFNHILWQTIEGDSIPYPGPRRLSILQPRRAEKARYRFWALPNDYLVSRAIPP